MPNLPQFPAPNLVSVVMAGEAAAALQNRATMKSTSTAAEASRTVAAPGRLFSVVATNTGSVNQFLQIFDAAALPANGTVPLVSIPLNAGEVQFLDVNLGLPMGTGICACVSTTRGTKTLGAADTLFVIAYAP